MDSNGDYVKQNEKMGCGTRLAVIGFFLLIGLIGLGVNLHFMFDDGWYYPKLSYAGGAAISFGFYMGLLKDTELDQHKHSYIFLILCFIVALLIGAGFNWFFAGQIY